MGPRLGLLLFVAALPFGLPATAAAEDVGGGCYVEFDHARCLGRPFKEDRSVTAPVVPPRTNFPPVDQGSLDMTGKKRFSAHTDSLRPDRRPQRAESAAVGRAHRYRPIPDRDGGRYIPGTRVGPSSPLFGRHRGGGRRWN
jgi:hypothetical protein